MRTRCLSLDAGPDTLGYWNVSEMEAEWEERVEDGQVKSKGRCSLGSHLDRDRESLVCLRIPSSCVITDVHHVGHGQSIFQNS